MVWKYEKFLGDGAIYAFCPNCNFHHAPSKLVTREDGSMESEIQYQYNYCPICGEYLYNNDESVDVTWNERHIEELWKMEGYDELCEP